MNNVAQTQKEAKESFLNRQQEQMLSLYEKADTSERNAIIKHIDSFLSTCNPEQEIFWLKFRRKLEVLNVKTVLFSLGNVYMTIGAREALEESNQLPNEFLVKHQSGNWGDLCEDDKKENELSVKEGFRILSAYKTSNDTKFWIITEADRSSTTLLLPCEY
jgi:hypothetical protein